MHRKTQPSREREEVGEVARELNEQFMSAAGVDRDALVKELVQVGACAVAWATALESPS